MIAYLKGKVLEKEPGFIILENQGVGYKLLVTPEVWEHKVGDDIAVYTYQKISDDANTLFGLPNFATLQFFEMLVTVTGVGPKMALTIVSAAKIETIQQAIAHQDVDIFTRMSGVGRKTAERIILELKNKILDAGPEGGGGTSDLYDALVALGYSAKEVRDALPKIDRNADMQVQLKLALKLLGK